MAEETKRFRILVCVDGSDDAYRGLKYAVRVGAGTDGDITLLYVRPHDHDLRTGGLQLNVARSNMLDWGLELPGMTVLKKGRDMLIDMGFMGEDWDAEQSHEDVRGDPLGDNVVAYTAPDGKCIEMKLMTAHSVAHGILDEAEMGEYDLTILGYSDEMDSGTEGHIDADTAQTVATDCTGSVLVSRELEESHGHLLCVTEGKESIAAAEKDAEIASRCNCPITLFSVAADEDQLGKAEAAVAKIEAVLEKDGIPVSAKRVEIGDPVDTIVEAGRDFSVIVLSATSRKGLRRLFTSSVAYQVLEEAQNSVLIAR